MKVGGVLTYSTCSNNPIENEAVVAAALVQNLGEYELLDSRHLLGAFRTRPGLTKWQVYDDEKHMKKKWDKKTEEKVEEEEIEPSFDDVFDTYSDFS